MPIRRSGSRLPRLGHGERVSVVAHLDELRTRIIVSLVALAVAFGLCFWQNHRLLALIDRPLAHQTQEQVRAGHGPLGATYAVQRNARNVALQLQIVVSALERTPHLAASRAALMGVDHSLRRDVGRLSAPPQGDKPVTLGIGEPFTTTVAVSLVFALILALPVLLLQASAFIAPAVEPRLRRRLLPLAPAVPGLFAAGVAFGYFVVLPAAVHFFQNFNSAQFNVLVQANPYYKFAATTLLAIGVLFELPVVIVGATSAGLITTRRLRRSRRYALAVCAVIAAVLPGDAITMLLETVPLYVLFEASVLVAALVERRARKAAAGRPVPA